MSTSSDAGRKRKKSLGQCFLEDRNTLALEARLARCDGKVVLEIGAGDGRLTAAVLAERPKRLIAVEKDGGFAAVLRERFSGRGDVEIIEADFLQTEPQKVDIVIGNIPYYISSDIVFRLRDYGFSRAVLMVQKEFAQKMAASPGDGNFGRLSVTSQIAFRISYERTVLRHLFRPVPKVDSAIITLEPTGKRLTPFEENIIRWIFQHKNQTVRNSLLHSKMFTDADIGRLGDLQKRRGRTLAKDECLEIARLLENV
ncbi:MAG: 16S rRNA (adenine(1518)-N(6)/adenine(1519)-N(6))-dimethyltransferase RsmA [Candidatus Micrarchaeia archaeon]